MNPVICASIFNTLITQPFSWLLRVLYEFCGNYGLAIILFTVIVKIVLLYFGMKGKQSTMKTSRLQPKQKALEAKFADDKNKYQMEVSKLYKEEGINPMTGCLWNLIPFPFLIGLYGVLRMPLTNLMKLSADQITKITDILAGLGITIDTASNSAYREVEIASHIHAYIDQIRAAVPSVMDIDFSFLGINLSATPQFMSTIKAIFGGGFAGMNGAEVWAVIGLFLLPIVSGGINFLSSWVMQQQNASVITNEKGERDTSAAAASMNSMKTMLYLMPLMSVYFGFIVPAGLNVYWIASSALGLVQDVILTKYYRKKYDAEDAVKAAAAAEKAAIEAEREAKRLELKKQNPEGYKNPNTSKRKIKSQQKAVEIEVPTGRLSPEELEEVKRKKEEAALKASGKYEPDRPYARGRAFAEDRFNVNTEDTSEASDLTEQAPETEND